jgi:flagellar biosynthetic protein FlhB
MNAGDNDRRVHQPSPKRVQDFRKRGEIALSRDLVTVATLLAGAFALLAMGPRVLAGLSDHMRGSLAGLDVADGAGAARHALGVAFAALLPVCMVAMVAALVAGLVQLGWPPALRGLSFDLTRPFSPGNLGSLVSPKAAGGRLFMSAAKLVLVGGVAALAVRGEQRRFLVDPTLGAPALGARLAAAAARVGIAASAALALLGALDYVLQRRKKSAELRMTPEELKREHREQEGDPQVRRRRRHRMRELAKRRLVTAVKGADVVIVNPTEYAVALRYQAGEDRAPRVLAKGRGAVAERIRELARQAGVPILPKPPLARLIHKLVPEGREIPPSLYHAVAEVLAYVYKLRHRRGA